MTKNAHMLKWWKSSMPCDWCNPRKLLTRTGPNSFCLRRRLYHNSCCLPSELQRKAPMRSPPTVGMRWEVRYFLSHYRKKRIETNLSFLLLLFVPLLTLRFSLRVVVTRPCHKSKTKCNMSGMQNPKHNKVQNKLLYFNPQKQRDWVPHFQG